METLQAVARTVNDVREKKPLVHHLTNYVTVNDCANIVLAFGGSPVMADDEGEVEEMVGIASALVLNIGTLNTRTIRSMLIAGKKANQLGVPVVLDPVGAGATSLRTQTAAQLMQEIGLSVLRGNMSEIKILAGHAANTRGVDSADSLTGGREIAVDLARKLDCAVAITGVQDIISDGRRTGLIDNGHPLLAKVTGTGCMATSLIACCAGVTKDFYLAACAGIMTMGLAGEKAAQFLRDSTAIGSFKVNLFNGVSQITAADLLQEGKFREETDFASAG